MNNVAGRTKYEITVRYLQKNTIKGVAHDTLAFPFIPTLVSALPEEANTHHSRTQALDAYARS